MYIPFYNRFIGGATIQEAIARANGNSWWIPIFDLAREGSTDFKQIRKHIMDLEEDISYLVESAQQPFIALKMSSFGSKKEYFPFVLRIAARAKAYDADVIIDAETSDMTKNEDYHIDKLVDNGISVFKTYQLYRKDAYERLAHDIQQGKINRFKLVRGAYMYQEGNENILSSKEKVDENYDLSMKMVLNAMDTNDNIQLMVATHNEKSLELATNFIDNNLHLNSRVYLAQLLGMRDDLSKKYSDEGFQVCKYVPYGRMGDCLPYFGRRLIENLDVMRHAFPKSERIEPVHCYSQL